MVLVDSNLLSILLKRDFSRRSRVLESLFRDSSLGFYQLHYHLRLVLHPR